MRVLHVIPSISPRRGGPSEVIIPMVAALRAQGIDAEIATSDEDAAAPTESFPERTEHCGVPVWFFPRWSAPFRPLRDYTFSPRFARWLATHLAGYDALHVHALFSHLPTTAMHLARRHQAPYLSRPLGQLGHWPLRQSALRKRLYLRLVEARNLRAARALHFTSEAERAEATPFCETERSFVIPHGIDLPELLPHARRQLREDLGVPAEQKLVLFLGRIHPKKGLDLLVRALAQLPEPRPLLLIAGEGDHRPEIERLVLQSDLARQVRWLGQVTGVQKQLLLQGADLFALTSHHENFGVAVAEALAAGTPVLVSRQVALAGEIEQQGLGLVAPLEVEAISSGMAQGLGRPACYDASRRRQFVQARYSWTRNAAALEQLYREIVLRSR